MGKTWNQKHSFSPSCFQFGLTSQKQSCKECWENKLRRHLYGWRASVQKSWRFTDPKEGLAKKNVCVCVVDLLWLCVFHVVNTTQGTSNKHDHFTASHLRFQYISIISPAEVRRLLLWAELGACWLAWDVPVISVEHFQHSTSLQNKQR